MDSHSKSFFGQNTGLILQSSSKHEPYIFFQCLRKKPNGSWEKPSQGEGKIIRFSLEEIIMLLEVLKKKKDSWSTYHKYKQSNTQISVNWTNNVLWMNIGKYGKKLDETQVELMKLLLKHILEEKIEFATGFNYEGNKQNDFIKQREEKREKSKTRAKEQLEKNGKRTAIEKKKKEKNRNIVVTEEIVSNGDSGRLKINSSSHSDFFHLRGEVQKTTKKALLIRFEDGFESWIPKSAVKNKYNETETHFQSFIIERWVLEQNKASS
jgi:hypothetical protein